MVRQVGALLLAAAVCLPLGCNCGEDPAASSAEDAAEPADADEALADSGGARHPDAAVAPGADAEVAAGADAEAREPFDAGAAGPDGAAVPLPDAAAPWVPDAGSGGPIVDLRADVNRNGTVDLTDPSEDQGEDGWDSSHGAIFLANIDDDLSTCPKTGTDLALAACNDADDEVTNGANDLLDLARLKTVPWPGAPADAQGTIAVTHSAFVRLFLGQANGTFLVFDPATARLSATQIRDGVELAIEGKDVVRDSATWDGTVDVTFTVTASGMSAQSDTVRLREAPMITRHHLDPPLRLYATPISGDSGSTAFLADLRSAISASGIANPLTTLSADDQWTQDYFETAYMAMPAVGGMHVIHVNVRSANANRGTVTSSYPLRSGGRVVFTALRGPDVAGVQQYSSHDEAMDTLDSFGNLETVPPYSYNGVSYPLGRVYRGSTSSWHPDATVLKMFESQQVQPPLYVDTSFLLVGHVDETVVFLKAPTSRGWTIAVADPTLAKTMLEAQVAAGNGDLVMFEGMYWDSGWFGTPADITIADLLADSSIMSASADAAAGIDDQVAVLKAETGITDAEILHFPVLFQKLDGYDVAYMVGTVNGISLGDAHYGAPEPHGPIVNGSDLFKTQLETELSTLGITAHWMEDWDLYHRLDGEVHCGSNTTRQVPATELWWESGR